MTTCLFSAVDHNLKGAGLSDNKSLRWLRPALTIDYISHNAYHLWDDSIPSLNPHQQRHQARNIHKMFRMRKVDARRRKVRVKGNVKIEHATTPMYNSCLMFVFVIDLKSFISEWWSKVGFLTWIHWNYSYHREIYEIIKSPHLQM